MEENLNEEKEFVEKKKGKVFVPILVTVVILLVIIGGYVGYFYFYQNTERYIDHISNNVTEFLHNNLKIFETANDNKDINLSGNLNIQNMLDMDYDLTASPAQKLMALDLNWKNILKGTINYQDGKIYAQSQDLYNGILELSDLEETTSDFSITNNAQLANLNISESLENIVKYLFAALKEGRQTTSFKGITEKVYTLKLDSITAANASQKFKTLVMNDESLKGLLANALDDNFTIFNPCEITVTVNVWTNKVKEFTFESDEYEINAHYDGEKYVVLDGGDKLYLWVEDDYFKIHTTEADDYTLGITINYKGGIELNYKDNEDSLNISFNQANEQNYKISADVSSADVKVNLTGNIEEISNDEAKGDLTMKVTMGTDTISGTLTLNVVRKENLIDKIDVSKAKKIDELTEDEQSSLILKLYSILYQKGLLEGVL